MTRPSSNVALPALNLLHSPSESAARGAWIRWRRWSTISVLHSAYPAERAGLRRGDVLLVAGGRPFHPVRSFLGGVTTPITVMRNGKFHIVRVTPVDEWSRPIGGRDHGRRVSGRVLRQSQRPRALHAHRGSHASDPRRPRDRGGRRRPRHCGALPD